LITAFTYILAAASLAMLLAIGSKQRHETTTGGDFFRYRSVYVWTLPRVQ
jgi:hypothetical protein